MTHFVIGKVRKPSDDLIPKIRHYRNQHTMTFHSPSASTNTYECSFFPQIIRNWNDLPESLISSAEESADYVSGVTSIVRARD